MKEIIEMAERLGYQTYFNWAKLYDFLDTEKESYCELCLIQKWLREEFYIIINIDFDFEFSYCYTFMFEETVVNTELKFKKFEEALKDCILNVFDYAGKYGYFNKS